MAHSEALLSGKQTLPFKVVDEKDQQKLVKALQPALYDLIAFGMVTKQAHWNVTGPNFRPIHLHLDEIYEYTEDAVDEVAERVVALGSTVSGQAAEVAEHATIRPIPLGFHKDVEIIDFIADRLEALCRSLRGHMNPIEDVDAVTADMLHQILQKFEMHHWMIRVQQQ